ncbi:MAG: alpha/beta hydrolase [Sinobacteraceae bacterium]|nr:alpha/beta hydrolase [Nevskiaceae bacterium]
MAYAAINGQRIYYRDTSHEAGSETGSQHPPLAFSHGLLMDHEMFGPQLQCFRHRHRCIVWDERGHGNTAGDSIQPFSYYDSADDLASLLKHLQTGPAVLVGMSQGGYLSLRFALTHPELVRGLVLIDSQAGLEEPDKLASYLPMVESWAQQGLQAPVASTIEQIIIGTSYPHAQDWKDKWAHWKPHNLNACFQTLAERDDITARLSEIEAPTLVIHGDADLAIPMERAKIVADKIPHARLVRVAGASHAANLTHPEAVNTAIAEFLEELG